MKLEEFSTKISSSGKKLRQPSRSPLITVHRSERTITTVGRELLESLITLSSMKTYVTAILITGKQCC